MFSSLYQTKWTEKYLKLLVLMPNPRRNVCDELQCGIIMDKPIFTDMWCNSNNIAKDILFGMA